MNRFQLKKKKRRWGFAFTLISFVLVFVVLMPALQSISNGTRGQQKASLENALSRAVVQCYALEGRYPESLNYLIDHYGVVYDKKMFFVDYQPIAENIKPTFTVIDLHKGDK